MKTSDTRHIRVEESDALKDRLADVMEGLSVSAFARKCGIGESTLRTYLNGAQPSTDRLISIADTAGVNIAWLAAGRGPKRGTAPSQVQQQAIQPAPAPALNPELLQAAVEGVQEGLRRINRTVPADKHAQLIVAAYELLLDGQGNVSKNNVINFIRAAA